MAINGFVYFTMAYGHWKPGKWWILSSVVLWMIRCADLRAGVQLAGYPYDSKEIVPTIVSCQVWNYYADFAHTAPGFKSEHGGNSVLQKTFPKLEILNFPIQFREVAPILPMIEGPRYVLYKRFAILLLIQFDFRKLTQIQIKKEFNLSSISLLLGWL